MKLTTLVGLAIGLLTTLGGSLARAQDLQTGLHYFAIENRDRGTVDQRGIAGANGIAFSEGLLLGPSTRYRIWLLQAATLKVGYVDVKTPAAGQLVIPNIALSATNIHDEDGDGLPNVCEFVVGTNPKVADSDGDKVNDGPEVRQGTDPLDGIPARTGIVASIDTPGDAVDLFALNDVVAVACSGGTVTVLNVFNRMNPRIIAQVQTPGSPLKIAGAGTLIAVADDTAGLAVIDISDPRPRASSVRSIGSSSAGTPSPWPRSIDWPSSAPLVARWSWST